MSALVGGGRDVRLRRPRLALVNSILCLRKRRTSLPPPPRAALSRLEEFRARRRLTPAPRSRRLLAAARRAWCARRRLRSLPSPADSRPRPRAAPFRWREWGRRLVLATHPFAHAGRCGRGLVYNRKFAAIWCARLQQIFGCIPVEGGGAKRDLGKRPRGGCRGAEIRIQPQICCRPPRSFAANLRLYTLPGGEDGFCVEGGGPLPRAIARIALTRKSRA